MRHDLGPSFETLYGTNPTAEEDGAWMDVAGFPGWRIRLRAQDSVKVRDVAQELARRHLALYQVNMSPTAREIDRDNVELLARAIVVAWEGFNGIPCTPETIREVMTRYPAFREACLRWAAQRTNFRQAEVEAMGKTLPSPSDVSSSSEEPMQS